MIDHSAHPHPSTPAARALCRANGGTGNITKTGTKAPKTSAPKKKTPARPAAAKNVPSLTEGRVPVTPKKQPAAKTSPTTKVTAKPKAVTNVSGGGDKANLDGAANRISPKPSVKKKSSRGRVATMTPDQQTALSSDNATQRQNASNNLYDEFAYGSKLFDKKDKAIDRKPAVREYFGNSTRINTALRNGDVDADMQETIDEVDAAMALTKTKTPLVVFRGVNGDALDGLSAGDTFSDRIFLSTALDPQQAKKFARGDNSKLMHIEVPTGTNVIAENRTETEILLPRDTQIEITGVEGDNVYGVVTSAKLAEKKTPTAPMSAAKHSSIMNKTSSEAGQEDVLLSAPVGINGDDDRGFADEDEKEAAEFYVASGYGFVNAALRGSGEPTGRAKESIEKLDAIMDRSKLPSDTGVYRGVGDGRVLFGDSLDGDLTGFEWKEKGYSSTSVNEDVADDFIDSAGDDDEDGGDSTPIKMRIVLPSGTPAFQASDVDDEAELIVGRGSNFRVIADRGEDDTGTRVIDVELVL